MIIQCLKDRFSYGYIYSNFIFFSFFPIVIVCVLNIHTVYAGYQRYPALKRPNQVDLWTQTESGCVCPFDNSTNCACCIDDNNCQCGERQPNRCMQCGLEAYCGYMCNMSINIDRLKVKSGAIYSPLMKPPVYCVYYFIGNLELRIKLQLYRLSGVGYFNKSTDSCEEGYIQVYDGYQAFRHNSTSNHRLCGQDIRFDPPIVMFGDRALAIMEYVVEDTGNPDMKGSRFMMYFSFESRNNLVPPWKSGKQINNADKDCDWQYHNLNCTEENPCEFSSPGYPGMYPAFQNCKYIISAIDSESQIRIQFQTLEMPEWRDEHDYLRIYDGQTTSSSVLKTINGDNKEDNRFVFSNGPHLLLWFTSGSLSPPFNYRAFHGNIVFGNKPAAKGQTLYRLPQTFCNWEFPSDKIPTGNFATPSNWFPKETACIFKFMPQPKEIAIVSLFTYSLEGDSCETYMDLYEISPSNERHPVKRYCSPTSKYMHLSDFSPREDFLSHPGHTFVVEFHSKLGKPEYTRINFDWLKGAFAFHNEYTSGAKVPEKICDFMINSNFSATSGSFMSPVDEYVYWHNLQSSICEYTILPALGQTVNITIRDANLVRPNVANCETVCTKYRCECKGHDFIDSEALKEEIHHITIMSEKRVLGCLCGEIRSRILPISFYSNEKITINYYKAQQQWDEISYFFFNATYEFTPPYDCGQKIYKASEGEMTRHDFLQSDQATGSAAQHSFKFTKCDRIIDVGGDNQIVVNVSLSETLAENSKEYCSLNSVLIYTVDEDTNGPGSLLQEICINNAITVSKNKLLIRIISSNRDIFPIVSWKAEPNESRRGEGKPSLSTGANASRHILRKTFLLVCLLLLLTA